MPGRGEQNGVNRGGEVDARSTAVLSSSAERVTLQTVQRCAEAHRRGEGMPFASLTCYDFTTARWLARAGVPVLLVGDTAAEVIFGHTRTIDMDLELLLALTAAVKRGSPRALVMGDMPFMSYQDDDANGIRNAGRFLTEGKADVVKVEADESFAPLVAKMVRAGVPVCGHVGSRPQRAALTGGYRAAGRTGDEARAIVRDAVALEAAGCSMMLIEAVPEEVTARVMEAIKVPVIGIGAGTGCDGQVLVLQDLVGMSERPPRFAEAVGNVGNEIERAGREWMERVGKKRIGGKGYGMKEGEEIGNR